MVAQPPKTTLNPTDDVYIIGISNGDHFTIPKEDYDSLKKRKCNAEMHDIYISYPDTNREVIVAMRDIITMYRRTRGDIEREREKS